MNIYRVAVKSLDKIKSKNASLKIYNLYVDVINDTEAIIEGTRQFHTLYRGFPIIEINTIKYR